MALGCSSPDEGRPTLVEPSTVADDQEVRKSALAIVAALVPIAVLALALVEFDPTGPWFAVVVVWAPMTVLGTISHAVPYRLPDAFHRLRDFERDGRIYELVGIRAVKALARRGPIEWFNPRLRLPSERTPQRLADLDRRMRTAEASHTIAFVITAGVAAHALARGWLTAAIWTLLLDVGLNAYPVALQRYNRALLAARTRVRA